MVVEAAQTEPVGVVVVVEAGVAGFGCGKVAVELGDFFPDFLHEGMSEKVGEGFGVGGSWAGEEVVVELVG